MSVFSIRRRGRGEEENGQRRIYVLPMIHNDSKSNAGAVIGKISEIIEREEKASIAFEWPDNWLLRRVLRREIGEYQRPDGNPKELGNDFVNELIKKFAELDSRGIRTNPIDRNPYRSPLLALRIKMSGEGGTSLRDEYHGASLEEMESMLIEELSSASFKKDIKRLKDSRDKTMLKKILKLAKRTTDPLIVMVGALHSPYIKKELECRGFDVADATTNSSQNAIRIMRDGYAAAHEGELSEEEKLALARFVVLNKLIAFYGNRFILYHGDIVSQIKSRQEASFMLGFVDIDY